LRQLAALSRVENRSDLIGRLVEAQDEGLLTEAELVNTVVTFMVGGHITTTGLIGNGILSLLRHPNELKVLIADPAVMPTALEEFLRYESPNQRIIRIVKEDLEIDGRLIRTGDRVMLVLGAANRDPAIFADAAHINVRRDPNRHLAFAIGRHLCVGAALARLEGAIAVSAVLRRFPKLRLLEEQPSWLQSPALRVLRTLPVLLH
jgi:cytochrome P450